MLERIPALVAALCLTIYWGAVVVKLVKLARKIGKDPNALPREWVGIAMRGLWYPCIAALLTGLWLAAAGVRQPVFLRWLWEPNPLWAIAAAVSMLLCILCTVVTFICWRKMGRSWRIGIDPGEKLDLVSTGPYRLVRHPIYALRMVINICAFVMAPTLLVLLTAGADFLLLQIEARREEEYMESKHGAVYTNYKNSVGRFVPRVFVG
ncbi:MAG TPA: isoprenylcysteine carboxylmethyltransferase family protein [Phycisphaerae bacterium]|nr:isoprenylcysteine carboxylmethyltransferase family protein [Phycisphaerae bacterium]